MRLSIEKVIPPSRGVFPMVQNCKFFTTSKGEPAIKLQNEGCIGTQTLIFSQSALVIEPFDASIAKDLARRSAFGRGYAFAAPGWGGAIGSIVGVLFGFLFGHLFGYLSARKLLNACTVTYANDENCNVSFVLRGPEGVIDQIIRSVRKRPNAQH
jgi:hypothetical protein